MDTIGWILLIIVVVCVIALILIAKKRKELEERISDEPEEESVPVRSEPEKKELSEETGPHQVTIYSYRSTSKMRLCPLCDGENDLTMTQCHICGQKLN